MGSAAMRAHEIDNMAAPITSGSYLTSGMFVAPCSIRSMSEIATGVTSSLLTRAAHASHKGTDLCRQRDQAAEGTFERQREAEDASAPGSCRDDGSADATTAAEFVPPMVV